MKVKQIRKGGRELSVISGRVWHGDRYEQRPNKLLGVVKSAQSDKKLVLLLPYNYLFYMDFKSAQ